MDVDEVLSSADDMKPQIEDLFKFVDAHYDMGVKKFDLEVGYCQVIDSHFKAMIPSTTITCIC